MRSRQRRLASAPCPGASYGNAEDPTEIEAMTAVRLPGSERALLWYLPAHQMALTVGWARREAIAVFGVVLAIITREFTIVLPFAGAALALLAIARPRLVELREDKKGPPHRSP